MKTILVCIIAAIWLSPSQKMAGTVWIHNVAKGCVDTLKINSKNTVTEFTCEMNYSFKGTYTQSNDTLIVTVKDDSHSEDGGKSEYYRSKYLIGKDGLYLLSNGKMISGKWKYEQIKSAKNIWYKKIR